MQTTIKLISIIIPLFLFPSMAHLDEMDKPIKPDTIAGWVDIRDTYSMDETLKEMKTALLELSDDKKEFESIRTEFKTLHSKEEDGSILFWCITKEGDGVCNDMLEDLEKRRNKAIEEVKDVLKRSKYMDYVEKNIHMIYFVDGPINRRIGFGHSYGSAWCDFKKHARISLNFPGLTPSDVAGVIVHEAAHLETCYMPEEYAMEKEREFKEALKKIVHPKH